MTLEEVRQEVARTFDYAYKTDDWVYPLSDALAGITPEEAAWNPTPDSKSIWEIVLHTAIWNENMVERLRTADIHARPEMDWVPLPTERTEAAWQEAQQRLWDSIAALQAQIAVTPPAVLFDRSVPNATLFDDILCRFIHNAYHIGQITKLRDCWSAKEIV